MATCSTYLDIIKKTFCQPLYIPVSSTYLKFPIRMETFGVIRLFLLLVFQWRICTFLLFFLFFIRWKGQLTCVLIFLCMYYFCKDTCTCIQIAHDKKSNPSPNPLFLPGWYMYVPTCKWQILKQKYSQMFTFFDTIHDFNIFKKKIISISQFTFR